MTTVERVEALVENFKISNDGEWGLLHIVHDDAPGKPGGWLTLTAQTTFGNVGYHWSSIGKIPWQKFMAKADKHNALKKLFGEAAKEFDAQGTVDALLQALRDGKVKSADNGVLRKDEIDELIEACENIQEEGLMDSQEDFAEQLGSYICFESDEWEVAADLTQTYKVEKMSAMAEGFWNQIWAPFVDQITRDLQQETAGSAPARVRPRA